MDERFRFRAWRKSENMYYYDAECTYDYISGTPQIMATSFDELLCDDDYIIEQCTGLRDKNGKLIYEGDLLGLSKEDESFIEICWCDTLASFMCDDFPETYGNLETCHSDYLSKFEIIGNIHEMEVKDE